MPDQEQEKPKQEREKPREESSGEAARKAAQGAKEKAAAGELAKAETGELAAESTEKGMEVRAREIAQKYLETIPKEDRELTDPKQVEFVLSRFCSTLDPADHLFSNSDKYGNAPTRVIDARWDQDNQRQAQGWREFAAKPLELALETDKVAWIAKSTLPESVRNAMILIILKEGNNSAVDMAIHMAERLEQGEKTPMPPKEHHDQDRSTPDKSLRQKAFYELLAGLYPDLLKMDEVKLLVDQTSMTYEQKGDRDIVMAMVERFNKLIGENVGFDMRGSGFNDIHNGAELLTNLRDGSIDKKDIQFVISQLRRELIKAIAKKAISAEIK